MRDTRYYKMKTEYRITTILLNIINQCKFATHVMDKHAYLNCYWGCKTDSNYALAFRDREDFLQYLARAKRSMRKCYKDAARRMTYRSYWELMLELTEIRGHFIQAYVKLDGIIRILKRVEKGSQPQREYIPIPQNEDDPILAELSWNHEMETLTYLNDPSKWGMAA